MVIDIEMSFCILQMVSSLMTYGGTTVAAPPPFRLGDPALCLSHPLITPLCYCRRWDFLCLLYMCVFIVLLYFELFAFLGFLFFCSVFPSVL